MVHDEANVLPYSNKGIVHLFTFDKNFPFIHSVTSTLQIK
jgi:hypothetical protein